MTTYTRNQPVSTDDLDISQPYLLDNTNAADSVFGFEHYAFSNTTANQGLHNTVTTPAYSSNFVVPTVTTTPPTTTTSPVIYGFQPINGGGAPTTNLGVLQYSRGVSDAVPSPLTTIQSPAAAITLAGLASTNILDFTGIPGAIGMVYAADYSSSAYLVAFFCWGGSSFQSRNSVSSSNLQLSVSGNILRLTSITNITLNGIRWTLQFLRTQ